MGGPGLKTLEIETYSDEIHRIKYDLDNTYWMYIGTLFVPLIKKEALLNELLNMRCLNRNKWVWDASECDEPCRYHEQNNTEIKYHGVNRSVARFKIAKRWIKDFLVRRNNLGNKGLVYFYILGLNLTKLDLENFGRNGGSDLNIYNRFFRSVVIGGAKYFFSEYDHIIVKKIYHDKGPQERHEYFPWYTGYRIEMEPDTKLLVEDGNVQFVYSDHRNYPTPECDYKNESQFIQFIDVILGSVLCCLHAHTKNQRKIELGLAIKPLLSRLMKNPRNVNSRYNYYRRQQICFFPKEKISSREEMFSQLDLLGSNIELESSPNNFYTKRRILLQPPTQTIIDMWY